MLCSTLRETESEMRIAAVAVVFGVLMMSVGICEEARTANTIPSAATTSESPVAPGQTSEAAPAAEEGPSLEDQKKSLAEAKALFAKKQYRDAITLLRPLASTGHQEVRWDARFQLGRSYLELRQYDDAIRQFKAVAEHGEALAAQGHYWLGHTYMRRRRNASARGCFADAMCVAPEDLKDDCLYYIGYTRYIDRHYAAAVTVFKRLLNEYPKSGLAKQGERFLKLSQERLAKARKAELLWTANVGLASTSEQIRFDEPMELGLGADARIGAQLKWEPRDGFQVSARAFGTRTSYLTGDLDDRQGLVAGLSFTHDLGDTRSIGWGLSYTENQRVDIVTSDSSTFGLYGTFSIPVTDTGRLSAYANWSKLKYYSAASSGDTVTYSLSYGDQLSSSFRYGLGASYTDSSVTAAYLSYSGPTFSLSGTKRLSKRRSLGAGATYTARNFDAAAPRQTIPRADRQRTYYAEYSQQVTDKVTITVGWRETNRSSTQASLNRSDPSWYIRTTRLLDLQF
ncbi:MAG: tetratricopeptide repeat protein [Armatimonadetes bacterium]|nr:tetratricopeptide repeat protein [Armatimonadota bacterium]